MDRNEEGARCPRCEKLNTTSFLKFKYISLNEMVLKCESSTCLFPFRGFKYKSVIDGSISTVDAKRKDTRQCVENVPASLLDDLIQDNLPIICNDQKSLATNDVEKKLSIQPSIQLNTDIIHDIASTQSCSENKKTEDLIMLTLNDVFDEINNIKTDKMIKEEQPKPIDEQTKHEDSAPKQSASATISRYLDLIQAKHKKQKNPKSTATGKIKKDVKKNVNVCDNSKIKAIMPNFDKKLNRPLDILKKIQNL